MLLLLLAEAPSPWLLLQQTCSPHPQQHPPLVLLPLPLPPWHPLAQGAWGVCHWRPLALAAWAAPQRARQGPQGVGGHPQWGLWAPQTVTVERQRQRQQGWLWKWKQRQRQRQRQRQGQLLGRLPWVALWRQTWQRGQRGGWLQHPQLALAQWWLGWLPWLLGRVGRGRQTWQPGQLEGWGWWR